MYYYFNQLSSTIDEARDTKYGHGDVVVAEWQTAGRGQRGKKWSSEEGKNLTFSVVLDTSFVRTGEQFIVLQAVSLALTEMLGEHGMEAKIKWPNDIYVGDRKIVGVLIEHSLGPDGIMERSGVGIGINVNQTVFESWLPNPTSMATEAGREFDRREVLERLYGKLMERVEELKGLQGRKKTEREYQERLYRRNVAAKFRRTDGTEFNGTIRGTAQGGGLEVETQAGTETFLFHEVAFVI